MTAMPGSGFSRRLRFVYLNQMARFWLFLARMVGQGSTLLVGMTLAPGCLVLGEPAVDEPSRSQPQLLNGDPAADQLVLLRPDETGTFDIRRFSAQLRSEDAGQPLRGVLLINYGQLATDGIQPWQAQGGATTEPAGTADVLRTISLPWKPSNIGSGVVDCKRVTMVVSHSFFGKSPFEYCPTDENDEGRLTWFVGLCGADIVTDDCSFDACFQEDAVLCPPPGEVQQRFDELTAGGL